MPLNHLNVDEMVFSPAQIATVPVESAVDCLNLNLGPN